MTPSQYIKQQGLPSKKYVADAVNVTAPTINNWYKHNFPLFEVVVAGVPRLKPDYPYQAKIKCSVCGFSAKLVVNNAVKVKWWCPDCDQARQLFEEKIE